MGMAGGAFEGDKERARQAAQAAQMQMQAQQNAANNEFRQQQLDQAAAKQQAADERAAAADERANRELDMRQQQIDFKQGMEARKYEDSRNDLMAQRQARQQQIYNEYANMAKQGRAQAQQRKADLQSGIGSAMKLAAENGGAVPSYILPGITRQLGMDGRTAGVVGGGYTQDGTFFLDIMRIGQGGRVERSTEKMDLAQQARVIGQLTGIFSDSDRMLAAQNLKKRGYRDSEIVNLMGFDATNVERMMKAEQAAYESNFGGMSLKDQKMQSDIAKQDSAMVSKTLEEQGQWLSGFETKITDDATARANGFASLKDYKDEVSMYNQARRQYYRKVAGMLGVESQTSNNVSGNPLQKDLQGIADRNAHIKEGYEGVDPVTGKRFKRVKGGIMVLGKEIAESAGASPSNPADQTQATQQTAAPRISGNPGQAKAAPPPSKDGGFSASELTGEQPPRNPPQQTTGDTPPQGGEPTPNGEENPAQNSGRFALDESFYSLDENGRREHLNAMLEDFIKSGGSEDEAENTAFLKAIRDGLWSIGRAK